MSGIKQVTDFSITTQVRRIAQEALAPLISQIQFQVEKVIRINQQMKKSQERLKTLEKSQSVIQLSLRELSKNISDIKSDLQVLNGQDQRNALSCLNGLQSIRQQINAMKRDQKKKQERIRQAEQKSNQSALSFQRYETSINIAIQQIRTKVSGIYQETVQKVSDASNYNRKMADTISETIIKIKKQRQQNESKFQILDLYLTERQANNLKIDNCFEHISSVPTLEQFLTIQQQLCENMKTIEKTDSLISQLPNREELALIIKMVNDIQEKVQDFARILELEMEVDSIKKSLNEDKGNSKGNHVQIETILNQIQRRLQHLKHKKLEEDLESLKTTNEKFRYIENKIQQVSSEFQKQLSQQAQKRIEQLRNISKDVPERQKTLKQQLVDEVSSINEIILNRCQKIEILGGSLEEQLAFFGNRITKMKSDNELHQENSKKEFKTFHKNRLEVQSKLKNIGGFLSGITEIITASNALSLYDSCGCGQNPQKLVYVTYNDGIICEIDSDGQDTYLTYRRKTINPLDLKKSIMAGLIQLIDRTMTCETFLDWKEQKPSRFFKQHILEHYAVQIEKNVKPNICPNINKNTAVEESGFLNEIQQQHSRSLQRAINQSIFISKERELSKQQSNQWQRQIQKQSPQLHMNLNRRSKISRERLGASIQKKDMARTIAYPDSKPNKGERSYNIKMKKKDKHDQSRHQGEIYTSRSDRYSRLNNIC